MQTIQVMRFGGPEVLEARAGAEPVADPGEALLAVEVADVLTLDAALHSGSGTDVSPARRRRSRAAGDTRSIVAAPELEEGGGGSRRGCAEERDELSMAASGLRDRHRA